MPAEESPDGPRVQAGLTSEAASSRAFLIGGG